MMKKRSNIRKNRKPNTSLENGTKKTRSQDSTK